QHLLHAALAVRAAVADDDAAAIVLDRAGEDLAGAGTEFVDQHDQRAFPGHARAGVAVHADRALEVLHLHDRAGVDEPAGDLHRFVQQPAAVVAQIDNHAVDALVPEVIQDAAAVGRRALALAGLRRVAGVEARQRQHADLVLLPAGLGLDDLALGLAVL